jgi:hypothetical protein
MKKYRTILNDEEMAAEHAWLVFLYGLDIVNNIMYHLHNSKDKELKVPDRYKIVAYDCVKYYNHYFGGEATTLERKKDGQTKK